MRKKGKTIADIAQEIGRSKDSVIKYLKQPAQQSPQRNWTTRQNPFEELRNEIDEMFRIHPSLEAKALLDFLIERYPNKLQKGHLRSLQRYLKRLRAEKGPSKEVMFAQEHFPGELSSSDFTTMNSLKVTLGNQPFDHLMYHFVLTYSNWEWGRICFSESLESLRSGIKECLLRLGGSTKYHLTDNLTAAVNNFHNAGTFKARYQEILEAFGMKGRHTQPSSPNENGDIEQRHYRFKKALDQALMLRGSRNFSNQSEYEAFLHKFFYKLNATRQEKVDEESKALKTLPDMPFVDYSIEKVRVSSCSTIRIRNCAYSVPSRLIGEEVEVRIYDNKIEVWYAQKHLLSTERLRGNNKHQIDYRHIIGSLKRKPGAFINYRYRDSLFPTTTFKFAYENLSQNDPLHATKIYLEILEMSVQNGLERVQQSLAFLLKQEGAIKLEDLKALVGQEKIPDITDVQVFLPDLKTLDEAFGLRGIV
ncbi:MAG: IS21 family transposase [Chlamydiota bacterium]